MADGKMSRDLKKEFGIWNICWHMLNSLRELINCELSLVFLVCFLCAVFHYFLCIFYSYELPLKYQKIPENDTKTITSKYLRLLHN